MSMQDENPNPKVAENEVVWERKVLEKVALSAIQELRRGRRWGILFKSLTLIYLFIMLFTAINWFNKKDTPTAGKHTALIDVQGVISSTSAANAEHITAGLEDAYKDKNTQGIILRLNSPGGSPVQAGYINDEIHRLRKLHPKIPVYAVTEDICASGCYYIAVAADKIFVDKATMIGSIGVLMDGFGFTGTMEKLGVERRLFSAGENKGFLDPFSPLKPEHKQHLDNMLGEVHQQFIKVVREGRGAHLKETPDIFSGLIWTGQKSIEMGLSDGLGNVDYVAREIIHAENIVDFTPHENFAEHFAKKLGVGVAESLSNLSLGTHFH